MANRNLRAKRTLEKAVPHVGNEAIVIAPGVNGQGYFATSMPMRTSGDIEHAIKHCNEALKKLRSWQRARRREEQKALDERAEVEA